MHTTTPSQAELVPVDPMAVGPAYAPTSPTAFVGLGARLVAGPGVSTVAAQRVMDRLQQMSLRVAVESADTVLAAAHDAWLSRLEELDQTIRTMPSTMGYISRDMVLAHLRNTANRAARI